MNINFHKHELSWVLITSALILVFSSLPYAFGYWSEGEDLVFNGAVFNRQDFSVHLAMMQAGLDGDWEYHFRFTSEDHSGAYIKQFYIVLGQLSRLLSVRDYETLLVIFHLARLAAGSWMCFSVYYIMAMMFESLSMRRLGFVIAMMASGFGWLQYLIGRFPVADISPIDFWLIDAYPFFSALTFPHLSAAIACMPTMIVLFASDIVSPQHWKPVFLCIFGAFSFWISPFATLLVDITMIGICIGEYRSNWLGRKFTQLKPFDIFRSRSSLALVLFGLPQIFLLIYSYIIYRSNPAFEQFALQNVTLSPQIIYYISGFGFVWIFAIIGMINFRNFPKKINYSAMFNWLISAFLLAYLPWSFQRRFMIGISIPLAVMSTFGLQQFWWKIKQVNWISARRNLAIIIFCVVISISNIYLIVGNIFLLRMQPVSLFDPISIVQAVDWLSDNASDGDIVLARDVETSQLLAARGGLITFWGHPIETLDHEAKMSSVLSFYEGQLNQDWLLSSEIDWVVAPGLSKFKLDNLHLVFTYENINIFEVVQ